MSAVLKPWTSIRSRLSTVFALFVLLVLGLGAFGIHTLSQVNGVSAEIRDHWLQATRQLGDLSNYMSDYRSAEGTHLLSVSLAELNASEREAADLDATVRRVQRAYEAISRGERETAMYGEFARQWSDYLSIAGRVLALSRAGQKPEAVRLYMTDSRRAFDAASATLSNLTDETVHGGNEATARAAITYARARGLIALAMGSATFLLVLAIIYITRSLTNPLLDIATRMRALAAHDTTVDIPGTTRHDEMGGIARSVTVFRDNAIALIATQRRLLEQASALESALEHERRITAGQRNFVSMTSHEFRTPLTIIDGHAQRLLKTRDHAGPGEIEDRATRIRAAVRRMTNIMDGLLGAARLLEGTGAFNRTRFELAPLIREVCQMHREMRPGVQLSEHMADARQAMDGDPILVFHALSNLVSNAVKYSPLHAVIDVSALSRDGRTIIEVRDQGMGIAEQDREHIFERYFRGRNAAGLTGTGVGLHLVSMVVALHDGAITVRSDEGRGSTFTLSFPSAESPAPASDPGPAAPRGRPLAGAKLPSAPGKAHRAPGAAQAAACAAAKRRRIAASSASIAAGSSGTRWVARIWRRSASMRSCST